MSREHARCVKWSPQRWNMRACISSVTEFTRCTSPTSHTHTQMAKMLSAERPDISKIDTPTLARPHLCA